MHFYVPRASAPFREESAWPFHRHALPKMPFHIRHDLIDPLADDVVRSPAHDDELGVGEELAEPFADGDGTDRVGVAPQEEHGYPDLPETVGEIPPFVLEPPWQSAV